MLVISFEYKPETCYENKTMLKPINNMFL